MINVAERSVIILDTVKILLHGLQLKNHLSKPVLD